MDADSVQPDAFILYECSLLRQATGKSCTNLRELLDAVREAPSAVLEHHLMRCALEDHFELYEFPNDLARWCWDGLGNHPLAEELALVDPYAFATIDELRSALVETIEDRLWSLDRIPWCRPGLELHLIESRLIGFDTGERFESLAALAAGIKRMTRGSVFFHVHEARRRSGGRTDDFSAWLEQRGAPPELVRRLQTLDFYFLNLNQLRQKLLEVLAEFLAEPSLIAEASL